MALFASAALAARAATGDEDSHEVEVTGTGRVVIDGWPVPETVIHSPIETRGWFLHPYHEGMVSIGVEFITGYDEATGDAIYSGYVRITSARASLAGRAEVRAPTSDFGTFAHPFQVHATITFGEGDFENASGTLDVVGEVTDEFLWGDRVAHFDLTGAIAIDEQ